MKVAILAGGRGTRLAEETRRKPKPLVTVGGRPVLWHIMRYYAAFGLKEFVVALGYKGELIEAYMSSSHSKQAVPRIHSIKGGIQVQNAAGEDWNVSLLDTGQDTQTGGRVLRLAPYLGEGTFMLTWSDGLADVNLHELLAFHRSHGRLATVTAVHPPPRFGRLELAGDRVSAFEEKPTGAQGWINGAFFVLEPAVMSYIEGDATRWEYDTMRRLVADGQLMAYRHEGFWQCMDTPAERQLLDDLWSAGQAPWKIWDYAR